MAMAQLQCFGCSKYFSPHGLSQHVSKTQDPHCHSSSIVPQFRFVSAIIPHMAFSLPLVPNHSSPGSGRVHANNLGGHGNEMGMPSLYSELSSCGVLTSSKPKIFITRDRKGSHEQFEWVQQ